MIATMLTGISLLGLAVLAGGLLAPPGRQLARRPAPCADALRIRRNAQRAASGRGR